MRYKIENIHGKKTIETLSSSKSVVKIGDYVVPLDGSWSLLLKDGDLKIGAVSYPPNLEAWKVIITEGEFPTKPFREAFDQVVPGQKFCDGSTHQFNDVMLVSVKDNSKLLFINSFYLYILDVETDEQAIEKARNLKKQEMYNSL